MATNVLTPREECRMRSHGFDTGAPVQGDVQRCVHGRYWMFHQYEASWALLFRARGYWFRLDWSQHPVWLWRARRALRSGGRS